MKTITVPVLPSAGSKRIIWQTRTATGSTEVESYDTLTEAIGSMAGHDGCGGVWEESRARRLQQVDCLIDDVGTVVAVAAYSSDDVLLLLVPDNQLHSYREAEARQIAARVATLDACGK